MSQLIDQHRWKHRVVLLFAEEAGNRKLQKQLALFKEAAAGMDDRDLVVYQIHDESGAQPGGEKLSSAEVRQFRDRYEAPEHGYTVILIGKDGTVKLREPELVSIEHLFGLIDSMPMRQAEMKEKGDGNRNP